MVQRTSLFCKKASHGEKDKAKDALWSSNKNLLFLYRAIDQMIGFGACSWHSSP